MHQPFSSSQPLANPPRARRPAARSTRPGLFALFGLSALVFMGLAGCESKPLPVGAVLPLTGDDAAYGQSTRQGMELAQEELRDEGRAANFVLTFRDSESSADVAAARYRELLDERTLVTIGGITPAEARALAPVAEERERVLLSPTAPDQELGAEYQYFYRLAPSSSVTGTTIANFAAQDMDLESMVLVAESKAQGDRLEEGLGSTFDRNGGEMLGRFDLDDAELSWALDEIRRLRPEAVALAGWGTWLAEMVRALRESGYRGKIFTPESFAAPAVRRAAGDDARGVLVAGSPFDLAEPAGEVAAFVAAYRAKYGEDPDVYAAAGWDAVLVLDAALAGQPNLPGAVREWFRDEVKDIAGLTGHIQFDGSGAATKYPRVYSVQKDLGLADHTRLMAEQRERRAEKKRQLEEERQRLLDRISQGSPSSG